MYRGFPAAEFVVHVLHSCQGFAPLKPGDVAAMVNHRSKVGYGDVIV